MGKKWLVMLMLAAMMVFAACGSEDTDEASTEEAATEATEDGAADAEATDEAAVQEVAIELDYKTGLDVEGFYENVTALDFVNLLDYKGLEVPADVHTVTDEDVQSAVDSILSSYTTYEEVTDRAIVDGDTVNIDYVGSVDGVEFDGGSTGGAGTEVTIGVTSYIDDFLEQLIGHTPGESFDIEVTFPEEYGNEELNGKDAVFAITINYISETVLPELTDDFVAQNLEAVYGWATVTETEEGIYSELQDSNIRTYIQTEMLENSEVSEIPEAVLDFQKLAMANYYKSAAVSYGVDVETFLSAYVGYGTLDELYVAAADQLDEMANFTLVVQAIAEQEELTVTDDVLADFFTEINGTGDYTDYEATYGMEFLKYSVLQELVLDYLVEKATLL